MLRPIDESKDKPNWYWLDDEYGLKLENIRKAVEDLYSENKAKFGDLAHYTPHDIDHCKRVENLLHRLIPNEKYKELTMKERFYLLASAWLHDIGMLKNVYLSLWPSNEMCTISRIRKEHHKATAQYITENWTRLGIEEQDKEILAKLCFFHRKQEDLTNCDEYFFSGNSVYRLRLLAAYLRLADALDICSDRTPAQAYAICLAYNIPNESKLHWIKHRIISGVYLDDENHKIYIQFKCPQLFTNLNQELLIDLAEKKLKSIVNLIIRELRTELYSLINVLVRNNITYYLDIVPKYSEVPLDAQLLADLREIIINYDIMNAPSASKLLNMILIIIANILGFHLRKNQEPINLYETNYNIDSKKEPIKLYETNYYIDSKKQIEKIKEFLKTLKQDILEARPCHLGLKKLITEIEEQVHKPKEELLFFINEKFQDHHKRREQIRKNAKNFFKEILKKDNNKENYNILLYGYSELVTKVICGFRDALIEKCIEFKCINNNTKNQFYNSEFEANISKRFKIFICDGQPKTQTSESSNYIYHDAIQYALYLSKRNFKNIIIIPDIISATILNCYKIDFLIVGANGIESKFFRHSGGHLGIVKLATIAKQEEQKEQEKQNEQNEREEQEEKKPKIILVTTTQKIELDINQVDSKVTHTSLENLENKEQDNEIRIEDSFILDIEGFKTIHLPSCGQNRTHIWLMKDNELIDKIQDKSIFFINPREDKIHLQNIDYIILDNLHNLDNEVEGLINEIKDLDKKTKDLYDKTRDLYNEIKNKRYLKQKEWKKLIECLKNFKEIKNSLKEIYLEI